MTHFASDEFWRLLDSLPAPIRTRAKAKLELLKANPRHPSLRFKKIGRHWSIRITRDYRALAKQTPEGFLWVWIGTHSEFDRLVG